MRHGRGVARGRAADAGLAKQADELARAYGKAFSRSLLGAGGQHAEGFENDPIMYESIGWSGGQLPPKVEAELSGRLSQILLICGTLRRGSARRPFGTPRIEKPTKRCTSS